MSETSIKVSIELLDKEAQKALAAFTSKSDAADKKLGQLKDTGSAAFNDISVHIGKAIGVYDIFVGNLAANLAIKAFDALSSAAGELFDTFVVQGVAAARAQEDANQALNIALAQTGIYSAKTAEEFQDLASAIQATTGIEDDAILTNAALIQSLGQLDKDGLKRATVAAVDLSAALGKDLASSAEIIGKAATGNVTALQKLGITIEKGASNAQTFERVLKTLEDRFGGSAAAKVNTFGGAVKLVEASFGDLQEEVGNTIVKNNVVIEVLKTVGGLLVDVTNNIKDNNQAWKELVGEGVILTIKALNAVVVVMDTVGRVATATAQGIAGAFNFTASALAGFFAPFSDEAAQDFEALNSAAQDNFRQMGQALTEDTKLGEASVLLNRLQEAADRGFQALKDGASTSVEPLNNTASKLIELSDLQKKLNEETKNYALGLAEASSSAQVQFEMLGAALTLQRDKVVNDENVSYEERVNAQMVFFEAKRQIEEEFFASQQERLNRAQITEDVRAKAQMALDRQVTLARMKNDAELTKFKQDQDKTREQNLKGSLAYISTLQQSSVKELFFVGKAAALAVAYIDAQAAAMKALSAAPPPFNFVLAGLVGAAAAVNMAKIASAQPPAFEQGGIVPGNSFTGDNVTARVNSGEMILNRSQQAELFKVANGGGASNDLDRRLANLESGVLALASRPAVIEINGKEVISVIRDELRAGRTFT